MNTPTGFDAHANAELICPDIPATIEAKIKIDIPFDIPFSVINSPNRITIIAPIARVNAVSKTIPILPVLIIAQPKR